MALALPVQPREIFLMQKQLTVALGCLVAVTLAASCDAPSNESGDSASGGTAGQAGPSGPGGVTSSGGSLGASGGELSTGMGGSTAGAAGSLGAGGVRAMGGASGAGGTGAGDDCTLACEKIIGAGCPESTSTVAECATDCNTPGECQTKWDAYISCIAFGATLTCNADGYPEPSGCDATTRPYLECIICAPFPEEDACDVCLRTNCCPEQQALNLASDAAGFRGCLEECIDIDCLNACISQYPIAGAAYEDAALCLDQNCATECT